MNHKIFPLIVFCILSLTLPSCKQILLSQSTVIKGKADLKLLDSVKAFQNKLTKQEAEEFLSKNLKQTIIGSVDPEVINDLQVNDGYIILFNDSISQYWSEKIIYKREHFSNMTVEDFRIQKHVTRISYADVESIKIIKGKRADRYDLITRHNYPNGYFGNIFTYEKLNEDNPSDIALIASMLMLFKNLKE
ncbi:MAG: hypothetical protein KA807_08885 [Prolixibacteraceae bacterium]|nr:hypothetical protein [Prolixibacteraceae bacterium]